MTDVRWLDDEEQRTWRAWLAMSQLLRAQIARDLLTECGLSEADFTVLVYLSEHPDGSLRMTDLADGLQWSRSRLSHQVARMEARGLVARDGCPSDARGSFARLTAAGQAEIQRAAPRHVASVRRHLFDVMNRDQMLELGRISDAVLGQLQQEFGGSLPELPPCPGAP